MICGSKLSSYRCHSPSVSSFLVCLLFAGCLSVNGHFRARTHRAPTRARMTLARRVRPRATTDNEPLNRAPWNPTHLLRCTATMCVSWRRGRDGAPMGGVFLELGTITTPKRCSTTCWVARWTDCRLPLRAREFHDLAVAARRMKTPPIPLPDHTQ